MVFPQNDLIIFFLTVVEYTNMDSEYLKQQVGGALAAGLSEVCQKKPVDPIDYLAKWLKKYVQNVHEQEKVYLYTLFYYRLYIIDLFNILMVESKLVKNNFF